MVTHKVNTQLTEVNIIRRSLYDLESQQGKVRQHYEDEISRLRAEIAALRQASHTGSSLGIPGLSPPCSSHGLTSGSAAITDSLLRDRDRERAKDRGLGPIPPDSEKDREKSGERREADRILDQRNSKRHKSESIGPGIAACFFFFLL